VHRIPNHAIDFQHARFGAEFIHLVAEQIARSADVAAIDVSNCKRESCRNSRGEGVAPAER